MNGEAPTGKRIGGPSPADLSAPAAGPSELPAGGPGPADQLADASGPALRRDGLLARIAPFAALALLAEASLALPPGPVSTPDAILSALILAVTAALVALVPWDRLPDWCDVAVPLLYTASVFPLIQAAGGEYAGIMLILLSPIIWAALYHSPWESACVSAAALTVVLAVSLTGRHAQRGRARPPDDRLGGAGRDDRGGRARPAGPDPPVPPADGPDPGAAARDEHPGRP